VMSIFISNDHSNNDDYRDEDTGDFNDGSLDDNYDNDNDDECKILICKRPDGNKYLQQLLVTMETIMVIQ